MRTAIIAGEGRLPAALAAGMAQPPLVAALDGFAPDGLTVDLRFRVERLVPFLRALERDGVGQVIFAGAVTRPRLDPALLDEATASLLPRLMAAMAQGDDATLRVVIELFEESGFSVVGVEQVAPALLPGAGVLAGSSFAGFPHNSIGDGVNANDMPYRQGFPYPGLAHSGRDSRHVDPAEPGCANGDCPVD